MLRSLTLGLLLALSVPAGGAIAQALPVQPISGTRLDVVATGEAVRVPDVATINAGVVTRAQTATAAIQENARRMTAVRAALKRAGIADRDIQTSTINLNPEYRYAENQPPQLVGYQASNQVAVRFRDIADSGAILDALVAQGANQINGPTLGIDQPEVALDEARADALTKARARAELYARALGKRVKRVLSISEAGGYSGPPRPMMEMAQARDASANTKIDPGEQTLSVTITASYELE